MRLNITMNDDVLARVDQFASDHHVTRSALLSSAVMEYMDAQEAMPALTKQLQELADKIGSLSLK